MDSRPDNSSAHPSREASLPDTCLSLARKCFAEASADHWQLSFKAFQGALARSAAKRFANTSFSASEFEDYIASLHLRDLALACACMEGSESAWEDFFAQYRDYLRRASAAILRSAPADPSAVELADSLFSDLYGLAGQGSPNRSLLRYFHGRSTLKTWLRAVLAQRHIDRIRVTRKFDSLDDPAGAPRLNQTASLVSAPDPRREQYLERFREALADALASLEERDRSRLQLYYAEEHTLAEIGSLIGEHESSVSRNLERVRKELRATVEGLLRAGTAPSNGNAGAAGFDDAQIALAIQYAAEDAAIDLDKLFEAKRIPNLPGRKPEVKP